MQDKQEQALNKILNTCFQRTALDTFGNGNLSSVIENLQKSPSAVREFDGVNLETPLMDVLSMSKFYNFIFANLPLSIMFNMKRIVIHSETSEDITKVSFDVIEEGLPVRILDVSISRKSEDFNQTLLDESVKVENAFTFQRLKIILKYLDKMSELTSILSEANTLDSTETINDVDYKVYGLNLKDIDNHRIKRLITFSLFVKEN